MQQSFTAVHLCSLHHGLVYRFAVCLGNVYYYTIACLSYTTVMFSTFLQKGAFGVGAILSTFII